MPRSDAALRGFDLIPICAPGRLSLAQFGRRVFAIGERIQEGEDRATAALDHVHARWAADAALVPDLFPVPEMEQTVDQEQGRCSHRKRTRSSIHRAAGQVESKGFAGS